MTSPPLSGRPAALIRAALWLLPVYAVLLALSTLTHQPDPATEFEALSRYVTTTIFLISHLVASILGAGLGLIGLVAALLFLVRGRAPTMAMVGTALTILANTLFTAIFAAAAFTQPAIGRAYLDGEESMQDLHEDVYGAPLFATAGVGFLLFIAGAIVFGLAVAKTAPALRWAGYGYATGLSLFTILGFTVSFLQPVAAVLAAVAATLIALRLPAATSGP